MKLMKKFRELLEVQTYPELEISAERQRQQKRGPALVVVAAAGLLK